MKKLVSCLLLFVFVFAVSAECLAKNNDTIYRKRAEWVKLVKLNNKQLAGQTLQHPDASLSTEAMTQMLLSLQMNKAQLLKKEIKSSEIFSQEEASRYAPLLVKALRQAQPNQVVSVSIVHKRPQFVVRNDFLSLINVYRQEDGLHFYFSKLFAKLEGDYEQASMMDEAIRKARSIRVSLNTVPGQIISANGKEIVLDVKHDFSSQVLAAQIQATTPTKTLAKETQSSKTPLPNAAEQDVKSRLKTLDELKASGLISDTEYDEKRKEILGAL